MTRRRTPGLRREEVAQRANVSATWYTWLEQGRGGAPSAEGISPEFARMWKENEVRTHSGGAKRLRHPTAGIITLEYSALAVDGRPDLTLVIYNPATSKDTDKVRKLLKSATESDMK